MTSAADNETILQIAAILEGLGPFPAGAPRHSKWRTTEQLANLLWQQEANRHLSQLEELLTRYETEYQDKLQRGLEPDALIRRAVYPDRTTALPLWGGTRHHGQPWLNQPGARRSDAPQDLPESRKLPDSAPRVFLSHANADAALGEAIADKLAAMEIATWMYETDIGFGRHIANSVRDAIKQCACCVALVTRTSMASLWVLTELHSAIEFQRSCILVLDASDNELMQLLRSLKFNHAEGMFDTTVTYDENAMDDLAVGFAKQQDRETRSPRYKPQVRDSLATLPLYLEQLKRPTFVFPGIPSEWSGPILVRNFEEIREFIYELSKQGPGDGQHSLGQSA